MKILFVVPYVPSPIRVRPLNFLKELSKRHEITLVALAQGDPCEAEALVQLRDWCEDVHIFPVSRSQALMNCAWRLCSGIPLQAAYTEMPKITDFMKRLVKTHGFDILHVEHIRGAHLVQGISSIPRIYDSVDCITRLLKQRLDDKPGALSRLLLAEELFKMRVYEADMARTFDTIVMTSQRDGRALNRLVSIRNRHHGGSLSISVVPNGVDTEYFAPRELPVDPDCIAFSGKMSYYANSSAVLRFWKEVFPLIRQKRPGAKFRIIGSNPPDSVRRLASDPAVEVTDYVPDLRPYLASAAVVVCPLTIGVGIQNKVLEAMAMGKPVVASSLACKGVKGAIDGTHCVKADSPEDLADATIQLLENRDYAIDIGENALRMVNSHYSWEAASNTLEEVYEQAIHENAVAGRTTVPA